LLRMRLKTFNSNVMLRGIFINIPPRVLRYAPF